MNQPDIIFLKIHKLDPEGTVESYQYEIDGITDRIIQEKFKFNCKHLKEDETSIRVIKLGGVEDLNPMNYATEISTVFNDRSSECKVEAPSPVETDTENVPLKRESKIPNIPTMIICQNCDTNFPTKYQYQRHQCEFNADKVILKPNADVKDIDKGMRMKFDCSTCGKQFVSKNNLDRHQSSHDETNVNICEYCNKQFVSENRLRIHKENHCKKAGDISKFYRSDVFVWKCVKCSQVFANANTATLHTELCAETLNTINKNHAENELTASRCSLKEEIQNLAIVAPELVQKENLHETLVLHKHVEKVSTELLLQCEFCNCIYADKLSLVEHQKSHATTVNYKCVSCDETFANYVNAAKHWLTKCTNDAKLFFLPKLTYCDVCDRTFKSHEVLYAHKMKKKHYNAKIHCAAQYELAKNKVAEEANKKPSKEKIVKLIEDVLMSMNDDSNASPDRVNITLNNSPPPPPPPFTTIQLTLSTINNTPEEDKLSSSSSSSSSNSQSGRVTVSINSVKSEIESEAGDSSLSSSGGGGRLSDVSNGNSNGNLNGNGITQSSSSSDDNNSLLVISDETEMVDDEPTLCTGLDGKKKRGRKRKSTLSVVGGGGGKLKTAGGGLALGEVGGSGNGGLASESALPSGFKYQCERCSTVFDTVTEMESHRELEHPANYKCEECDQVVHSSKALLIHSRAHQSLKPYVCEICKRCYSQTSHLWQHMRFHQGIKPFACPHEGCEARYTIRPDLKDHIRKVHTRERPFKCSVCDKCFLTGSVYYQHRLIHTNDRRYGCDICHKRFFRADALNNHRRIHTDERPYPCDVCGRQFRQKGDRNKHLRTQHPAEVVHDLKTYAV